MNEKEWIVELVEFPDYFISTKGRIFSEKRGNEMREMIGSKDKDGYIVANLMKEGKKYCKKVHRLVCLTFLERVEGKNEVDHKNRIKSDNRLENLKWCNRRENNINIGLRSDNTSGIVGVRYHKQSNLWEGRISIKENKKKLRYFKKKEDAIKWRLNMVKKYYN